MIESSASAAVLAVQVVDTSGNLPPREVTLDWTIGEDLFAVFSTLVSRSPMDYQARLTSSNAKAATYTLAVEYCSCNTNSDPMG